MSPHWDTRWYSGIIVPSPVSAWIVFTSLSFCSKKLNPASMKTLHLNIFYVIIIEILALPFSWVPCFFQTCASSLNTLCYTSFFSLSTAKLEQIECKAVLRRYYLHNLKIDDTAVSYVRQTTTFNSDLDDILNHTQHRVMLIHWEK